MTSGKKEIRFEGNEVCVLDKWKVRVGARIGQTGHLLFTYRNCEPNLQPNGETLKYKCKRVGIIIDSLVKKEADLVVPNDVLIEYTECLHNTVMKDLCADCGANINSLDDCQRKRIAESTSISMVHSVPELRVSKERAETLGRADEQRLLKDRKLVLLVDLDQTLIHSTNHNVPQDMPSVHHFQLYGPHTQWYHTKFRPHTLDFLEKMSKLFELHICTFGARRYAHAIAHLMDPKEMYFPKDRILSRDECFDSTLKTANMKSLFPCGDAMVCIIDDREDVWNFAPNLVSVKPYVCFRDTGDINAPEMPTNDMFGNRELEITDKTVTLKEITKESDSETNPINESTESPKTNEEYTSEVKPNNDSIDESGQQSGQTSDIIPKQSDEKSDQKSDVEQKSDANENSLKSDSNVTKTVETEETNPTEKDSQISDINHSISDSPQENNKKKSEDDSNSSDIQIENNSNDNKSIVTKEGKESGKGLDIEDNDDYLLYLEEILSRIHSEYYKEFDEKMKYKTDAEEIKLPDLKLIIPTVRKCVLRGVNVVFSGVIPTNIPPEKNRLFNIAKSFGATVTTDLVAEGSPKTTHLVASKWGTVKVNKCIKLKNIHIVSPNWLYSCSERWERVDERLYPLEKEATFEKEKSIRQTPEQKTRLQSRGGAALKSQAVGAYATYDPKTGKRIQIQSQAFLETKSGDGLKSSGSNSNEKTEDGRQIEPHNMLDFSPLSGFSLNELQSMGKEVDDACSEGDELSTGNTDSESDIDIENVRTNDKRQIQSSSEDSNDGECPKGWNKNKKTKRSDRRHVLELEEVNDSTRDSFDFENRRIGGEDEESTDNESIGSVDEEMALAVEREFLS